MRQIRFVVAVIALVAVTAGSVFAQSNNAASTTIQNNQQNTETKTKAEKPKPSLLLSYMEKSESWLGGGDINSVAPNGWDGDFLAFQLKRQVYQYNDGSTMKVFASYDEYSGDATATLDPKLKLGKSTTYKGDGNAMSPGLEYGKYHDDWYDFFRVNYVFGEEEGSNNTGYRQKTKFRAWDFLLGTVRLDHHRTWFSETDFTVHYREHVSAEKDSSFAGKPLSAAKDPVASYTAWEILVASDIYAKRWNKGLSRFAVGALYERSHWQSDGSDRDRVGVRLRYMQRINPGKKKGSGSLIIVDITPYRSYNTGVEDFKGVIVGASLGFGF